jgi:hypothetical protein
LGKGEELTAPTTTKQMVNKSGTTTILLSGNFSEKIFFRNYFSSMFEINLSGNARSQQRFLADKISASAHHKSIQSSFIPLKEFINENITIPSAGN